MTRSYGRGGLELSVRSPNRADSVCERLELHMQYVWPTGLYIGNSAHLGDNERENERDFRGLRAKPHPTTLIIIIIII